MEKQTQITYTDRELILILASKGYTQKSIGEQIGKHQSSISRELRRGGLNRTNYSCSKAQVDRNQKASNKGANLKIIKGNRIFDYLKEKLLVLSWSPEQISGYLNKDKRQKQISYETIYRYIYSIEDPDEKSLWIKSLRQKRRKRRSRKNNNSKRGQIPNRKSIHDRPKSVDERNEGGHWEGDLIIGKNHSSAIGTSVERVSRYTVLVKLPERKTSNIVVNEFAKEMMNIPQELRKTFTYDNGHEMSCHELLSRITGMDTYFADPGCPGQRGTNENTNGLIRDFFPKGTDFNKVSRDEIKRVEKLLNQRPRKILNYATPEEELRRLKRKSDPPNKHRTLNGDREAVTLS